MTEPTDRQRVELRLPAATVAAAKLAAHHHFLSLNAWVQETIDQRLDPTALSAALDQLHQARVAIFDALDALTDAEGATRARSILLVAANNVKNEQRS